MANLFKIKDCNSFVTVDEDVTENKVVVARHIFLKSKGLILVNDLEVPTKEQVKTFFDWTETIYGYPTTNQRNYNKDIKLVNNFLSI